MVFNDRVIYCEAADVYLNPWLPIDKAIITHHTNVPTIKYRLGAITVSGKNYNETFIINNVKFSLHPAGHIIGSSQIKPDSSSCYYNSMFHFHIEFFYVFYSNLPK